MLTFLIACAAAKGSEIAKGSNARLTKQQLSLRKSLFYYIMRDLLS